MQLIWHIYVFLNHSHTESLKAAVV